MSTWVFNEKVEREKVELNSAVLLCGVTAFYRRPTCAKPVITSRS